ncbi:MAG TPA: crotonase/enoyl-CoA hydratase family protein [Rhizomicrobium sp.]|nr:crotonase/enoyl-CoA hydratase family protein [Rhizomicrobium sp.]
MSIGGTVRTERRGEIATVILDRPQARNAVDRRTADALVEAFLSFERDETAKVAVLWGAGGVFCAGADLKALAAGGGNRLSPPQSALDALAGDAPMGPTRMRLSKPVIAAIAGHAVAGGLELALWCDLRVAEEDAVFGVYCRRWGVPLIDGGTVRLPRLIGQSRALDMILTGRPVRAMEAFAMGLANRLVKRGESRSAAEELALELARFPQVCLKSDRKSVYEQCGLDFAAAMANEFALGSATLASGESRAGAEAFASGKGRGGKLADF